MAFNISIVAFGKEPDISDEMILEYRGFDPVLVGKTTQGTQHFYKVKTEVPDVQIIHVQIRDELIDSPNMVLVFENAIPADAKFEHDLPPGRTDALQAVFKETMHRLGVYSIDRMEGPWLACGVMAYTFLDVREALSKDLAKAERSAIFKGNKHD
ncbi:hypothetical protein D3C81_333000 [compost metagenome]